MAFDVSNQLLGLQFGFDAPVVHGQRFSMDGYVRAGVYANITQTDAQIVTDSFPPIGFSANDVDRVRTAFVGEVGVDSRFRLNEYCNLYGGYRLMLLGDVSQAGDQLGATNLANGRIGRTGETVVVYGGTFGLEVRF